MSGKLTLLRTGFLGFVLVIAIGLVAYMSSKFMQYRQIGDGPIFNANGISVTITNPGSGYQALAGSLQSVNVLASGPHPVIGVELWVDGDLVGAKESPTLAGVSPFAVSFTGLPFNPGAHMLLARAKDTNGGIKDSDIVWIYITENPNAQAEVSYLPQPATSQINPPPSGETVDETATWSPSIGGFIDWWSGSGDALEGHALYSRPFRR